MFGEKKKFLKIFTNECEKIKSACVGGSIIKKNSKGTAPRGEVKIFLNDQ